MAKMMRAARPHEIGGLFQVELVPRPEAGPGTVLVKLAATGIGPGFRTILSSAAAPCRHLCTPALPAVFGLGAVGHVARIGPQVSTDLRQGDRVYLNPALSCGDADAHAGLAQFLAAPAASLTVVDDRMTTEQAVRLGCLSGSYQALSRARFRSGDEVLIEEGTGAIGVCAVIVALALGAATVYATGHCRALLDRLRAIDPARVVPIDLSATSAAAFVAARADGRGLPVLLTAPGERQLWFDNRDVRAVMQLVRAGRLNLDVLEHERFTLDEINAALHAHEQSSGGFTNLVLTH